MLNSLFSLLALLMVSFSPQEPAAPPTPPAPSAVPADVAHMVNPVKATPESQAHAKKTYGYDCAMCHGATGDGKGELAISMKLTLKDFTDEAALKDMSDGEMYYVIKNGKGQMPAEGDRGKPADLWNMVTYTRSFAKK